MDLPDPTGIEDFWGIFWPKVVNEPLSFQSNLATVDHNRVSNNFTTMV